VDAHDSWLTEKLVWIVMAVVSAFYTLWNTYITGRIGKVEEQAEDNEDAIQAIQVNIEQKFAEHDKEERQRDEMHSKEVTREFKDLRKEMVEGHAAILEKVNEVGKNVNDKS
jgi:hypothetical protein